MTSPAPPIDDPQAPASLPTLADELLEDIFLRLPTADDLVRAFASCTTFSRIITSRQFLRRFRAVHPPPLLGFAAYEGFCPAQPPHPSAPLASAFADAADFSYSFVPTGRWNTPWHPRDVRQGRVLLECTPEFEHPAYEYYDIVSVKDLDLAVCDPLSRRYRLLPRIPKQLRAQYEPLLDCGLFFAPTGEDDDETTFGVVCMGMAHDKTMLVVFLFTSVTGQWDIRACSSSWSYLAPVVPVSRYSSSCLDYEQEQECFYWMMPFVNILLVLDVFSMELSVVSNLASYHMQYDSGKPLIVEGTDGGTEVFFLADFFGDGPTNLIRLTKQSDSESSDEWQLANTISLPSEYNYFTLGAAQGFLFLRGVLQDCNSGNSSEDSSDDSARQSVEPPDVEYFSLDVKTSTEPMKICGMKRYIHTAYPYFGYPPPLAKPAI
ncbi:hypothetical protein BS78_02G153400 [Paspalum vaginatum]|nr:hypothetical protein BS78_02G153400 [Paspalum vaginatum]